MNIKHEIMLLLSIVLICCAGTVCAADSNNTMDMVCDVDSNEEFISISRYEQVDDVEESVLSTKKEKSNNVTVDDEKLSLSNEDSLAVTAQETNQYLNDIKTTTSDEFYKFVDYLIKQKGFKFNAKNSDDGYTIYSSSNYQSILFDGENYVLPAGTPYFISKNRISYVLDEYYPDMLYLQNGNTYVDELYLGWLKNVENYHPSLNIAGTNTPIYIGSIEYSSQEGSSNSLPSSFDLRNVNGKNYVTPIRDQANSSICWAFGSIAALESFLLKHEGKSYEFSTKYDFSENNLKNVMSNIGKQGIFTRSVTSGGNDNVALAYFIRWSGPILEEYDKYDLITVNPINNIPLEFFNSDKHVRGVKYIHARNGSKDNEEIKRAIMDYGAVATSLLWNSKFVNGYNYYCYDATLAKSTDGHEICIIGWDDNYKKTNFGKVTPPEDGAFIVKNSWGSDAGDNGYYYISYCDATLAKRTMNEFFEEGVGFVFTSVEDNTNYGKNYNYNPQGVTFWLSPQINGKPATTFSYYSQWVATDDDNLKACGIYINDACECSINVYVDGILKGTTNNVPLSYAGFHTIQLSNMVPVKNGQKFRMEVTIKSKTPIRLPAELSWKDLYVGNPNDYNNAHANIDETGFINGYGELVDITNAYKSCNLCMNVYTEYKKILDTKIDVSTISMNNGIIKDITVKLSDSNNNVLKNFELISCKGSNYQVLTTNNDGEATFAAIINDNSVDMCIYYLGSVKYNRAFKELKISMEPPKVETPVIVVPPKSQPPVSSPTTNIPNNPVVTKPTSTVTVLKIKYTNQKYSPTAKVPLTLKQVKNLKVTVTGNKKPDTIPFKNYEAYLPLSKFGLKNKKTYSFNFAYSSAKYELKQTIKITTK